MNGINWNMNCIVKKNNIVSAPALKCRDMYRHKAAALKAWLVSLLHILVRHHVVSGQIVFMIK